MRFIADIMVGKLAKYLRMAGHDVLYINTASDDEIIKIAIDTGRMVLTRDSLMLARKEFKNGTLKNLYIKNEKLKNQLGQIKSDLKISLKPNLVRCVECNQILVRVKKEDIKNKIPPYVFKTQQGFLYCKKCDKYYWKGTHYQNIKNIFLDIGQ
ncbi:MAG: Mut7-C RNAse domain-containing protein [Actinomycetota bacterium]|nr:Mut7-C RNAse domain-containing protein [Actinomycetota bacterium]